MKLVEGQIVYVDGKNKAEVVVAEDNYTVVELVSNRAEMDFTGYKRLSLEPTPAKLNGFNPDDIRYHKLLDEILVSKNKDISDAVDVAPVRFLTIGAGLSLFGLGEQGDWSTLTAEQKLNHIMVHYHSYGGPVNTAAAWSALTDVQRSELLSPVRVAA